VSVLAVLGPRGTYTEAAARRYDPDCTLRPEATFTAAFEAVERGEVDGAVCAIENSLEGAVTETVDLLLGEQTHLQIRAEVVLPIRHALVAAPGVNARDATVVYSHPQALAQTRRTLRALAPDARPVAALSTAAAIEAALAEPGALAIGSHLAAEQRHGAVLHDDVSDEPGNATRFVVIAAADSPPTGDDKTSIAFTTRHDAAPGSLVEVLTILSSRSLNMTRIESRPTRRALGTYVFLVDFLGHREDAVVADALREMRATTRWLRVLGSYPRWREDAVAPDRAASRAAGTDA